jgi:oligosaccharide repeat unit polymerase
MTDLSEAQKKGLVIDKQGLRLRLIYLVLSPIAAFAVVHAVVLLSYLCAPMHEHFTGSAKYFSVVGLCIYIVFVVSFLAGAALAKRRRGTPDCVEISSAEGLKRFVRRMDFVILLSLFLVVAAYYIWFGRALASEGLSVLWFPFVSDAISCKELLEKYMIEGLTTLTQLGPFVVIASTVYLHITQRKYYYIFLLVVFGLSVIRVVYFCERLAFLELLVPLVVLRMRLCILSLKVKRWLILGIVLFGTIWSTELIRSYGRYAQASRTGFLLHKLFAYFVSGLNNFLAYVDFSGAFFPKEILPHLLSKFYTFAGISTHSQETIMYILDNVLTPDYTVFNGMGYIYMDFGLVGAPILLLLGYMAYSLFVEFKKGTVIGLFVYPLVYLTIIDSFRIIYISLPRGAIPFLTTFLISMLYYSRFGVGGHRWRFL